MSEGVNKALRQSADPVKAAFFPKFFKAGYLQEDKFLGVIVPKQLVIAKAFYKDLSLEEIESLLHSEWHEERLTALFILVLKFQKGDEAAKQAIYELYLKNTQFVNNWDLVDSSAEFIVGPWLDGRPEKMEVLETLAHSPNVWERRIAILSTFHYIKLGNAEETLHIIEKLLNDPEDYIHKAVGWMLREIGKRVDRKILTYFLDKHAASMPRTALRYAIEHLPPEQRRFYLTLK